MKNLNQKTYPILTQFDPIIVGVTREEIESRDPSDTIKLLSELENQETEKVKYLRGKISLMVDGYDTDSDELFEIADFCVWASKLSMGYNAFAYFLNAESIVLVMMAALHAKIIGLHLAEVNPEQQQGFLQFFLGIAIDLGIKSGYAEEEMIKYFNKIGIKI